MNQPSARAAAAEAPQTGGIHVPGNVVSPDRVDAGGHASAREAELAALIRRERRRAAEARAEAEADAPGGVDTGAHVCCVMCYNQRAAAADENAGSAGDAA